MQRALAAMTALALRVTAADAHVSRPAASLDRCAQVVGSEGARFERESVRAMETCLHAMATAVVRSGLTPAAAATAVAPRCARAFRRLHDSRRRGVGDRMAARIAARCDPGHHGVAHTLDDVTGKGPGLVAQPIATGTIDAWCRQFGGDGSIETVAEWIACIERSHENAARVVVSAEFPRAGEWLSLIVPAMEVLRSPPGDPGWAADAAAAAAAATAGTHLLCSAPGAACGNGIRDPTEDCDGADLGGTSCAALGFVGGVLACDPSCRLDTTGCLTDLCGDGVRDGIESCDGSDLGGATCTGLGFLGGTLACGTSCRLDTSGCLTDLCGNGVRDGIESCDGLDLGGATCASLGFGNGVLACTASCRLDASGCTPRYPATGQTTCWNTGGTPVACAGTGQDGDVQAGAALAYTDNGDGTISDLVTGLMWEKKSDDGSVHDKDTLYNWTNAFAVHLAALNGGGGFAGHTDWRLPNPRELQTIVHYESVNPAVAAAFNTGCVSGCTVLTCSCTTPSFYWTSTTSSSFPTYAWYVNFASGSVLNDAKTTGRFVRAVRGGG